MSILQTTTPKAFSMEAIDTFFKEKANKADPTNAALRLLQTLEKHQVKLKNALERAKKRADKEKDAANDAVVETAQQEFDDGARCMQKFATFCSTLRCPPPEAVNAEKLAELPFCREKTRLFSIHTRFLVPATSIQKAAESDVREEYNAAKIARETIESFRMNPSPAVVAALDEQLKDSEFEAYLRENFGPMWAYDNVNDCVPTKTIDVTQPGKAAKKATIAVVSEACTDATYSPFDKILRVFYHLFVGWISEKAVNFRPKKRSDLSFLFSMQMLTGHDTLPEVGSEEAIAIAHKLQSAIYVVTKTACEPLLAHDDGLPVPATKAMRNAATKDSKVFVRNSDTPAPDYQLMFSLAFPEETKLQHGFAAPLDGRFFIKLTPKVAKFVAEAVTKLVGEDAIVPVLRKYLAHLDDSGKYKGPSIDFATLAGESAKTWTMPTEADLTKPDLPTDWAKRPLSNPYSFRLMPDGTKQLRLLSLRNLASATFFEDCLLALHALDTTPASTDELKNNYDGYVKKVLEGVAFESTGVDRSASFVKSQTRTLAIASGEGEKKRKGPSEKTKLATALSENAELREKLRLLEEKEDEESLATTAAKRQKTSSLEDKVDKLYALVARAFPDEVMEVEED